jgi:hypothetical protein
LRKGTLGLGEKENAAYNRAHSTAKFNEVYERNEGKSTIDNKVYERIVHSTFAQKDVLSGTFPKISDAHRSVPVLCRTSAVRDTIAKARTPFYL